MDTKQKRGELASIQLMENTRIMKQRNWKKLFF